MPNQNRGHQIKRKCTHMSLYTAMHCTALCVCSCECTLAWCLHQLDISLVLQCHCQERQMLRQRDQIGIEIAFKFSIFSPFPSLNLAPSLSDSCSRYVTDDSICKIFLITFKYYWLAGGICRYSHAAVIVIIVFSSSLCILKRVKVSKISQICIHAYVYRSRGHILSWIPY